MFTVGSGFIGNFKLGDNINHNLAVLALLYRYSREGDAESKRLLCKPITILLVSVIEAVLHDFHSRIRTFTWEGVINLPPSISEYVRSLRRIDELEKYIASAKKHDFFDAADQGFYDQLDELRRIRNRVHIQNLKGDFEANDFNAFNDRRKVLAEKVLEKTMKVMLAKYPRTTDVQGYVAPFILPWNEHFPA